MRLDWSSDDVECGESFYAMRFSLLMAWAEVYNSEIETM